jgi:ribosome-binding protein aMBF1 (putative translation factor)
MMQCEVCGKDYKTKSLKREAHSNFRKCDECHYAKKAQKSVAHANRKSQTETMRLERRIEKLEKKNEMLEVIIESMVNVQVGTYIQKTLSSAIKAETNKQLNKLQKQIIEVNNKYVRHFGVEDECEEN